MQQDRDRRTADDDSAAAAPTDRSSLHEQAVAAAESTEGAEGTEGIAPDRQGAAPAWAELPESVRTALLAAAAGALDPLPAGDVPHALVHVARFVPAKRARSGAAPLARALATDAAFRALVAQSLSAGNGWSSSDPVMAAARAYLLRSPGTAALIAEAARVDELAQLRAQVAELTATVEKLTARLVRDQLPRSAAPRLAAGTASAADGSDANAEIIKLRARLREQGTRLKTAATDAARAVEQSRAERDDALAELARERDSAQSWRARSEHESRRADAARQALDRARTESGRERADGDRRLTLLLDTVVDAAVGLRREWRLATEGADPADVVARQFPATGLGSRRQVDKALLLQWIGLPGAHLIVDGYNVTKTGYPDLTLAEQRDRLIRALGALSARTAVEVTVVFDGAAVVAAPASTRQVRVVFSPPGVIADDVVRKMAAAEPAGRVVVVVSSDREVIDGVRRSGARTAPSIVLLDLLG